MGEEYTRIYRVQGSLPHHGNVIFADDMEDLLKWTKAGTGGDDVLEKSQTYVLDGNYSLHIKSRTTGAAQGDIIDAYRDAHILPAQSIGFSADFLFPDQTKLSTMAFHIYWYDGSILHYAYLSWNKTKWQFYNTVGALQDIPGGTQSLHDGAWHRLHFTLGLSSGNWGIFQCDGIEADLSSERIHTSGAATAQMLRTMVRLTTAGAAPVELYLDQVALLQE